MKPELLIATSLLTAGFTAQAAEQRPNILWLTFEDTSADFIGCYGNTCAKTPNMDALARTGTRFDAAFSTGSVSSPSRFCLITGVRAFSAGNGNHRSAYPVPQRWEGFPFYLRQSGYYTTNNSKTDYNVAEPAQFTRRAWDECSGQADWRGRKPGQPFFAVYNSMSSHQSRTMTDPWDEYENKILSQLDEEEKTPWGNLPMPDIYLNSPEMQKNISRVYNSITKTDKEFGLWLDKLEEDGLKDSTIVFCFSDHGEGIPRGKCSPVSMGYRVPFIVWIPPMYAHLSPYGSGIVTEELVSFEDFAPTVLSLAGVDIPEHMEGKPFLGDSRASPKKYVFSGTDRADENTDMSRSVTDGKFLYTRCFMPYQPFVRWIMYFDVSDIQSRIRSDFAAGKLNDVQRSILLPRSAEYLYDIRNDQWETVNLAGDKKYAAKLNELRTVLKDNLIATRDAGFIPEHRIMGAARKGIAPYDLKKDEKMLPIREVVDIAFTSGMQEAERQIEALGSPNDIVKYWAAIGLYSQKGSLARYKKRLEAVCRNMTYSMAKVYLQATLIEKCGDTAVFDEFIKGIGHPYPEVERLTLQLLLNMDEGTQRKALPFVEARMVAKRLSPQNRSWCELLQHKLTGRPLQEIRSRGF